MTHEDEGFICRQLILPLTNLKLSAKVPVSEALLRRRLLSLSEAAREALVGMILCELGRRGLRSMSEDLFEGLKRALVHHPEATAIEVARVHAAGSVMAAGAWERMWEHRGNTMRLADDAARCSAFLKRLMHPVPSDRFYTAQIALQWTTATDKELTDMCGGVSVWRGNQDRTLFSEHGMVVGVNVALDILERKLPVPMVVCPSCYRPIKHWKICERCFDHVFCTACSSDDAALRAHAFECARSQALVQQSLEETRSYVGTSPTHVTVLQLDKTTILPARISESATSGYGYPSSVLGRFLRAPCGGYIASLYEAPLMRFLAEETGRPEPSDSGRHGVFENILGMIMTTYENACLKLVEKKKPEKPARLSKAELRRQRIEKSRSQKEADAAAAAEEAARQRVEADNVLGRQTANARHSSVLTSVLAKRAAMASPEAVAMARKRRDELLGAERAARRQAHGKTHAKSERVAAAGCIQRAWRQSRRRRRKEARIRHRRAAQRIQLAARMLIQRRPAAAAAAAAAATNALGVALPAAPEAQGDSSCVVCLERPRSVVLLPCRHLGLCETCAPGLATCPLCRETVNRTLVVFT